MKPVPGVWGIDLGQCALKALRLQEIDGQLTATAFDYVEYPKILSQPDADPDQLTREALEQFLSRNTLRGDTVAIAVPGQSGLARFVKLPPVEEKKIADIVRFEAKQQIPFNLDEVVWDYQKIGASNVVDGFALETEIGLFAMKRDMVNRYLQHFKDVHVEVHVIQMAPLALCNFLAYDVLQKDPEAPAEGGEKSCVVALDLGTDSSNLVITDGGKIIWQRPIPLGGNHFTRALTKEMKLTFAKAEHLKRNATKSGATELKKILAALKPVLNDFVGEVQRSLGYFTNTHRDATIEYMIGLGNAFRLPGMQRFLSEKLQLEVRKVEKMSRLQGDVLSGPIYQENILSFGVAYGLALQGMHRARLITNLLPGEIRMERLVRAKKPWAVAAAGILLLGFGAAALGSYLNVRPYVAPRVQDAVKNADGVAGKASTAQAAFDKAKKDATDEEAAVSSIVAGQPERLNWVQLLKFLSECVPQPDGSNLPPDEQKRYMDILRPRARRGYVAMTGREALKEYNDRIREGYKPPAPEEGVKEVDEMPPGIDSLVQLHIESIDSRFCDDLASFWKLATKNRTAADVQPEAHYKDKLPEGKGWVIEISGFTYHHDKEAFIRNTFLKNIARLGIKTEVKVEKPAEGGGTGGTTTPPAGGGAGGTTTPPADGGTGGTTPPAEQKDDIKSTEKPVIDRVGHVLLFNSLPKSTSESGGFELISGGVLDALVSGGMGGMGGPGGGEEGRGMAGAGVPPPGAGGSGMPGGPAMPGGPGGEAGGMGGMGSRATRSSWVSLSSRGGGGSGMGGPGMPEGPGGRDGGVRGPGAGMPGRGPVGPGAGIALPGRGPVGSGGVPTRPGIPGGEGPGGVAGGTVGGGTTTKMENLHWRTEFVILLIWKEPIPSDGLRGVTEDASGGGGTTTTGSGTTPP